MRVRALTATLILGGAIAMGAATLPKQKTPDKPPPTPAKRMKAKTVSPEERIDALSRARVWMQPPTIAKANLGNDPKQLEVRDVLLFRPRREVLTHRAEHHLVVRPWPHDVIVGAPKCHGLHRRTRRRVVTIDE